MTTVLRPRTAKAFENYGVWLVVLPPLIVLVLPALLVTLVLDASRVAEFYGMLLERGNVIKFLIPIAVLLPATLAFIAAVSRSKLELSDTGVRFVSGLPGFLKAQADWEARWDEMESVSLETPPMGHPLTAYLQINASAFRRLAPWQWIDASKEVPKANLGLLLLGRKQHFRRLIAETPLVLAFQTAGKLTPQPIDAIDENAIQHADLPSKLIAAVFVSAVAYFIGDSYFGLEEYYVGKLPWQWYFALGLFAAAVAWLALNAGKSSAIQAPFIALLFGGGIALAAHPGLLRLNAWLDTEGLVRYEYTLGAGDTWSTPTGAPDLVFDIDSRYWDQFQVGAKKAFEIRQGGLGFAQVNMAPIYAEQRAFYAEKEVSLATDESQDP